MTYQALRYQLENLVKLENKTKVILSLVLPHNELKEQDQLRVVPDSPRTAKGKSP